MGFIDLHHRAAILLLMHAVEESVDKRNIYLVLFQFSSGCFPVVDMHASKHAKKLRKAELSIQLRQITTSFDKPLFNMATQTSVSGFGLIKNCIDWPFFLTVILTSMQNVRCVIMTLAALFSCGCLYLVYFLVSINIGQIQQQHFIYMYVQPNIVDQFT